MRPGVRGVEIYRRAQFLERSGQIVQVVPGRAQPIVRVGPVRLSRTAASNSFSGLFGVALILQRERQIVMCIRVSGLGTSAWW